MKTITLSNGKFSIVDDSDFEYLNQFKWSCDRHGYAYRGVSIKDAGRKGINISMHREIMCTPKGMDTDHINCNPLDNRKSNLRICTTAENRRNSSIRKDNTSGYKGVSWFKSGSKWWAYIYVNGKTMHLGYHEVKEIAAQAYNQAALEHFGEFAKLNVIV